VEELTNILQLAMDGRINAVALVTESPDQANSIMLIGTFATPVTTIGGLESAKLDLFRIMSGLD